MPDTTNHCGYCNALHDAGSACTCPEQRRAMAARTREMQVRYANEKAGIAEKDAKKYPTGRN